MNILKNTETKNTLQSFNNLCKNIKSVGTIQVSEINMYQLISKSEVNV